MENIDKQQSASNAGERINPEEVINPNYKLEDLEVNNQNKEYFLQKQKEFKKIKNRIPGYLKEYNKKQEETGEKAPPSKYGQYREEILNYLLDNDQVEFARLARHFRGIDDNFDLPAFAEAYEMVKYYSNNTDQLTNGQQPARVLELPTGPDQRAEYVDQVEQVLTKISQHKQKIIQKSENLKINQSNGDRYQLMILNKLLTSNQVDLAEFFYKVRDAEGNNFDKESFEDACLIVSMDWSSSPDLKTASEIKSSDNLEKQEDKGNPDAVESSETVGNKAEIGSVAEVVESPELANTQVKLDKIVEEAIPDEIVDKSIKKKSLAKIIGGALYKTVATLTGTKSIIDWLGAGLGALGFKVGKKTDVYKYFDQKKASSADIAEINSVLQELTELVSVNYETKMNESSLKKYDRLVEENRRLQAAHDQEDNPKVKEKLAKRINENYKIINSLQGSVDFLRKNQQEVEELTKRNQELSQSPGVDLGQSELLRIKKELEEQYASEEDNDKKLAIQESIKENKQALENLDKISKNNEQIDNLEQLLDQSSSNNPEFIKAVQRIKYLGERYINAKNLEEQELIVKEIKRQQSIKNQFSTPEHSLDTKDNTNRIKELAKKYNQLIGQARSEEYYNLPKEQRAKIDDNWDQLSESEQQLYGLPNEEVRTLKLRLGKLLNENIKDKKALAESGQKKAKNILQDYIHSKVKASTLIKDGLNTAFVVSGAGFLRGYSYIAMSLAERATDHDRDFNKKYSWNKVGEKMSGARRLRDIFSTALKSTFYGMSGRQYSREYYINEDGKLDKKATKDKLQGVSSWALRAKSIGEIVRLLGITTQTFGAVVGDNEGFNNSIDNIVNTLKGNVFQNMFNNWYQNFRIDQRIARTVKTLRGRSEMPEEVSDNEAQEVIKEDYAKVESQAKISASQEAPSVSQVETAASQEVPVVSQVEQVVIQENDLSTATAESLMRPPDGPTMSPNREIEIMMAQQEQGGVEEVVSSGGKVSGWLGKLFRGGSKNAKVAEQETAGLVNNTSDASVSRSWQGGSDAQMAQELASRAFARSDYLGDKFWPEALSPSNTFEDFKNIVANLPIGNNQSVKFNGLMEIGKGASDEIYFLMRHRGVAHEITEENYADFVKNFGPAIMNIMNGGK